MFLKIHEINAGGINERIVCVSDEDLLGKTFEEGEKNLWVKPRFYKGKKTNEKEISEELKNASIMNFVGKESVGLGIKQGYIEEGQIITIQNIPHAQVVFMKTL